MRILITGISGFVGSYLTPYLLEKGHEVFGIDRHGKDIKGAKVISCDLLDKDSIFKIVSKIKPDKVFHLGGISSVSYSFQNPELTQKINVDGTKNLLDAIIAAKITPKILIVSSAQVYGAAKIMPITEETQLAPASPYATSKVDQEKLCMTYKNKLHIIIVRSFNHTGPGQKEEFVCSSFAKQVVDIERDLSNELRVGNLNVSRDFTDVRDVIIAYDLAIDKCKPFEIYNMCSGKAVTLSEIIKILTDLSVKKIKITKDKSKIRKTDAVILYGSHDKITKAAKWKPSIPFNQTLKDILDYWRRPKHLA